MTFATVCFDDSVNHIGLWASSYSDNTDRVADLTRGEIVFVLEKRKRGCGFARVISRHGVGWVSAYCLVKL